MQRAHQGQIMRVYRPGSDRHVAQQHSHSIGPGARGMPQRIMISVYLLVHVPPARQYGRNVTYRNLGIRDLSV